ncbi:MAG: hypothetical protein KDN19_21390 [Verrucomicrobiae bacterium]|nr:hypothetical protein [Verrucomicrobiae bacterium]
MNHAIGLVGASACLVAVMSGMTGCQSSPGVVEKSKPVVGDRVISDVLNPKKLSKGTRERLEKAGLAREFPRKADEIVLRMTEQSDSELDNSERTAIAEILCDSAASIEESTPFHALERYLTAARIALPAAVHPSSRPDDDDLLSLYNHACGHVAELVFLHRSPLPPEQRRAPIVTSGPLGDLQLSVAETGDDVVNPATLDELKIAEYLEIKGFQRHEVEYGVGAAVVGHQNQTPERLEHNPFMPEVGMALPLNAVLNFPSDGTARLSLYDTLMVDSVVLEGNRVNLDTDLTAPLALLAGLLPVKHLGIKSMLRPADYLGQSGLFQLEPFRPGKIPVILVHGLSKSPTAWVPAVNALRADPEIRENFQFVLFRYPSGLPATYCGEMLRHHLKSFQDYYDPDRKVPAMQQIVLVGKSFGGVTSSQQIRESGESIRELFSTKPLDEVIIPEEERDALKGLMYFSPNPGIRRTVFMGTPHRGTDVADTKMAHLASRVIRYPFSVIVAGEIPENEAMTPLARTYLADPPNSVVDLQAHNPVLEAIVNLPISPRVTVHSIVGKHGDGPLETSNDKMVPYWSSHIDQAVSELVVPCIHGELESHPKSIAELQRILHLHLEG